MDSETDTFESLLFARNTEVAHVIVELFGNGVRIQFIVFERIRIRAACIFGNRSQQRFEPDRQLPHSHSGCVINGVRHRGIHAAIAQFTHPFEA